MFGDFLSRIAETALSFVLANSRHSLLVKQKRLGIIDPVGTIWRQIFLSATGCAGDWVES
jgi:hypothetical protein